MDIKNLFVRASRKTAAASGHPYTFIIAVALIVLWAVTGPLFGFSDTWQLVINTSTTIITFLMVFLIQGTQNRDSEALHLKIDELLRATPGAHLVLMDLEKLNEDEFEMFRKRYDDMAREAHANLQKGIGDTDCPDSDVPHPDVKAEDTKICK